MNVVLELLSGGFLRGYRTYVIGFLMFLTALGDFLVGDINLTDLIGQMPTILTGLGIMTLRASVPETPPTP